MQESDRETQDQGAAQDAPTEMTSRSAKRRRPQSGSSDPVSFWLGAAIFGVIIIALASVASGLVFGMFNISGAPRTQTERDLAYYGERAGSDRTNAKVVAQLVDTLLRAGQLNKAQETLDQAMKTAKADRSYLYAEQAQVYLTKKRYDQAAKEADKAMKEAEKELEAYMDNNEKNNRRRTAGARMPESYGSAALVKAGALVATKDWKGAVTTFDAYLVQSPTDSDVLCARAQAKVELGDKAGAAADFREALKFVPDYEPALQGLKQIGEAK